MRGRKKGSKKSTKGGMPTVADLRAVGKGTKKKGY